ncbi:MAG TPA: hypothetical protein VEC99_10850, partial [Clostridia bacterium]|nr:hypothetical protein [Clostridia bacterium]
GGLVIAAEPGTGRVCGALFQQESRDATLFGLILAGDNYGPFQPVAWQTNRWYWLRLRHETNSLAGYPDLWARLWPADGETPEPTGWTTWRDYFPSQNVIGGMTGISAGQGLMEIDWFLLKSEELSTIVAHAPALKPALATLVPLGFSATEGFKLSLRGDPGVGYILEGTSDFKGWNGSALVTDSTGAALFQDQSSAPQRFYRARLAQ